MTDKNLNLANSALRLVVAYDDLMRCYTGPVSDLTKADNAAIDEAYDQMVAAARITLDVTARSTPPAPEKHVGGIVPPNCTGYSFVLDPGVMHVRKDGSGYIVVDENDFVLEDDRCEGEHGPEGSVHWIVRLDASEITALRDFLNGARQQHLRARPATAEDINKAFDPANEVLGGAFMAGFREGWIYAEIDADGERYQEMAEEYAMAVDTAPGEAWDAHRATFFAMLPLAAIPEMGAPIADTEAEIARVVQSVNEWDDRTSPDDYPDHLLITSEELTEILRNFADTLGGRNNG